MKKFVSIVLTLIMMMSLVACGNSEDSATVDAADVGTAASQTAEDSQDETEKPENITVTCLDGNGETVEVTVPYDPQRVAVIDFASLDILDNLGLGDRVVGSVNVTLDYISSYNDNENVANLGTIKEPDMEAIMECEPEIIFMAGRASDYYDDLAEIAPVVRLTTDSELGLVESVRQNGKTIASIFGLEDQVDEKLAAFDERIAALGSVAEGKTALVGMFSGGSLSLLGNDGRCSIIGTEIGFENIGISEDTATATHGNEVSYEFILDANPDYMFIMNRDAAIGADGADLAQDVIENELVTQTDTYKNGNIIYLKNSGVWYTAEGGITALDIMLQDLETVLLGES
ncbi:MAG: siderophore ABC transporter substrate-binding protein [Roseburia sp.]